MNIDPATVTQLITAYGRDPILAARSLFPHWFPRPMAWYARGIIAILLRRTDFLLNFSEPGKPEVWEQGSKHWTKKDLAKLCRCFRFKVNPKDPKSPTVPIFRPRFGPDKRTPIAIDMVLGQSVCLIIPRGFSKTTLVNFCNLYKTLYQLTKFTVYISEAKGHAMDQLDTIRRELSGNERIIALFGQLKPERSDDETWGAEKFETKTGVKFAAKGRGAQIRGLNKFGDRPDTIVLDDVEDKESVATPEQREKVSSWFVSDVEQALRRDVDSCIYAIGTMLHPNALLPTLAKRPDYTSIVFGCIDPEGEPLWDDPAGLSMAKITAKKNSMAAMGKLFEFYLEFMSTEKEDARLKFRSEYIRYKTYRPEDFISRSIHVDPAIGKNRHADFACIAVVGQMENGHKHLCDFFAERGVTVHRLAEIYFKMKIAWDCTVHSCEATAYQAALAQVIRELMFREAKKMGPKAYFEILETWPQTRKIERVEGILQPIMAAGYLTFQQIWPELEIMLLDWPNAKLDGPDALAGAIANLEPWAPFAAGDKAEDLAASMYDDHDFEAPCAMGMGEVP